MSLSALVTGVDFVSLPTQDLERATTFYAGVLGLEAGPVWQRPGTLPWAPSSRPAPSRSR